MDNTTKEDDYDQISTTIERIVNSWQKSSSRYQDIDQRIGKIPVFNKEAEQYLMQGKYAFQWRDIRLQKDCREMMIYQSMLSTLKPRTIIEMGTLFGGSAVWFADMMKAMELKCHVYTVDLTDDFVKPLAKTHPGVTCIPGNAFKIKELMPPELLSQLPHPWLVIEDCHANVLGSMEHFGKNMVSGDYFAIEDTAGLSQRCYAMMKVAGDPADTDSSFAVAKHKVLIQFLTKYKGIFKVDSYYTDMFGFNGTSTWDGYISKM